MQPRRIERRRLARLSHLPRGRRRQENAGGTEGTNIGDCTKALGTGWTHSNEPESSPLGHAANAKGIRMNTGARVLEYGINLMQLYRGSARLSCTRRTRGSFARRVAPVSDTLQSFTRVASRPQSTPQLRCPTLKVDRPSSAAWPFTCTAVRRDYYTVARNSLDTSQQHVVRGQQAGHCSLVFMGSMKPRRQPEIASGAESTSSQSGACHKKKRHEHEYYQLFDISSQQGHDAVGSNSTRCEDLSPSESMGYDLLPPRLLCGAALLCEAKSRVRNFCHTVSQFGRSHRVRYRHRTRDHRAAAMHRTINSSNLVTNTVES